MPVFIALDERKTGTSPSASEWRSQQVRFVTLSHLLLGIHMRFHEKNWLIAQYVLCHIFDA